MIKVLQIIDGKSFGGICKLFIDIEKKISKNIKFDYLTATNIDSEFYNLNIERKNLKGRIIYNHRLYEFLKNHNYDIVHINSGAFFFTFCCVIICKISGIKKIVVHSHNTPKISKLKKILIKVLNPLYRKLTDAHLSCSEKASKSLFTKTYDAIILKNGIDANKFKYNEKIRNEYRKELNIENKIVYGHVGRFDEQKNHNFLIDLFYEIQNKQDAVLLLVGTGKLENQIKEKVKQLKIEDEVLFLGFRKDINNLLNTMDIFLFPSIHEGLPICLVEALTSGLPTFVSNGIPEAANISNNFYKINTFDIKDWTKQVLNVKTKDRTNEYQNTIKKGFDIKETSKQLEQIYKDLIKWEQNTQ